MQISICACFVLCVAVSSVPGRDFLRALSSPARLEQDTLSTHQRDCIVNCTSKPRNSRVHVAVVIPFCSARLNADSNLVFAIGRESHRVKVHPASRPHSFFIIIKVLSANAKSDLEGFWITCFHLDAIKCFTPAEIWSAGRSTQEGRVPIGYARMFHRTLSYLRQYGVSHWL